MHSAKIPINKTPALFTELEQILRWNEKRPQIAKDMLKKKTKAGGITKTHFKFYHKLVVIRTVWYWHRNSHINQWNGIVNAEMDSQRYGQLIFNKAGRYIQWKKDNLFNKWFWENWTAT